jgi:hypothetical protein
MGNARGLEEALIERINHNNARRAFTLPWKSLVQPWAIFWITMYRGLSLLKNPFPEIFD